MFNPAIRKIRSAITLTKQNDFTTKTKNKNLFHRFTTQISPTGTSAVRRVFGTSLL